MKGKFGLSVIPIAQRPENPFITKPQLPRTWQNITLVFASFGCVVLLIVSAGLIIGGLTEIYSQHSRVVRTRQLINDMEQNPENNILDVPLEFPDDLQALSTAMGSPKFRFDWLRHPEDLEKVISDRVPQDVLNTLGLNPSAARERIIRYANRQIRSSVAQKLWLALAPPLDSEIRV